MAATESAITETEALPVERVNLNEPKWDQSTYVGRAKHFFTVTNPMNLLLSSKDLDEAKQIVTTYKQGLDLPGVDFEALWRAKYQYDSAFHPDTGEKMFLIGRMSAQVPMNMTITGCMMTFYKTTPAVLFWQWINQSFNAIVNYTNRSGDSPIPVSQLGLSYCLATGGAITTAMSLNSLVKRAPPLVGRLVPFAAVAAANCINIPMMRMREIRCGIPVFDEDGNRIGDSQTAAKLAITQVVFSRVAMASPGMVIPTFIMNKLDKGTFLKRYPWANAPIQVGIVGLFSLAVSSLESELQEEMKKRGLNGDRVYFNKGL
ncbi:putative sideroflexin-1 [Apostichopus japonicus]|uniref:Sidoreflexin n=1 Tax=Stichopus japonicus TaxID=307972 RepID=A0A2G8KTM3_STIJA|nr:putative sideroflexin-1 [Apostichopus japonicus]